MIIFKGFLLKSSLAGDELAKDDSLTTLHAFNNFKKDSNETETIRQN